jgi:hypothetical protein
LPRLPPLLEVVYATIANVARKTFCHSHFVAKGFIATTAMLWQYCHFATQCYWLQEPYVIAMNILPWQYYHLPRVFIRCKRLCVIATTIMSWQYYQLQCTYIRCERFYVIATTITPWQYYHLPLNVFRCESDMFLPRPSYSGNTIIWQAILFVI